MSLVSSHWYDRAIAAEAEAEALRAVNHSDPEVCPLWYDGCNCYEAFIYWRDRAEAADAEARAVEAGYRNEIRRADENYLRATRAEANLTKAHESLSHYMDTLAAEREAHEHTRSRERELERGVKALQELVRQGGKHGMDTAR